MNKRYVVPEGMREAVQAEVLQLDGFLTQRSLVNLILEIVIRWLSEKPIMPTDEQMQKLYNEMSEINDGRLTHRAIVEWQRRMFLAPELEVPEEVKDLLMSRFGYKELLDPMNARHDADVLEAYRRGQQAAQRSLAAKE